MEIRYPNTVEEFAELLWDSQGAIRREVLNLLAETVDEDIRDELAGATYDLANDLEKDGWSRRHVAARVLSEFQPEPLSNAAVLSGTSNTEASELGSRAVLVQHWYASGHVLPAAAVERCGRLFESGRNSVTAVSDRLGIAADWACALSGIYERVGVEKHDATRSDPAPDNPSHAHVRPGLLARLFGGGHRVEDTQSGLVRYEQKPGLLRSFARRTYQREAALSSIRAGFSDLSDMMGDIRDGREASVEKQGALLEHLKYLPVVAEQNQKLAERFEEPWLSQDPLQMETIRAIREQIRGQHDHQKQITRVLGSMGRESRDQQRDLDDLRGRLERMRQSDEPIADNLSNVGNAVRKVSEHGSAQGELVLRMQESFEARTRQLQETMHRQSSRQGLVLTVAMLLALLALAAVAVVGFWYLKLANAI